MPLADVSFKPFLPIVRTMEMGKPKENRPNKSTKLFPQMPKKEIKRIEDQGKRAAQ